MRVLIVKLSSLGDVVHTMPVVHDIRTAHPDALIDWVVEPGFAPLVRRVQGVHSSIECALRRWRKRWWTSAVRAEWHLFREAIGGERYDAVIDFQGLTKSALVARLARGPRYGLANRTEGASHEWPARCGCCTRPASSCATRRSRSYGPWPRRFRRMPACMFRVSSALLWSALTSS